MPPRQYQTGITVYDKSRATPGYSLFTPLGQFKTYIINMQGEVMHTWDLPNNVGNYAYLLPNGNLLAAIRTDEGPQGLPAKGGHLIEYDWDNNIVWEHVDNFQHHDFRRLPNGNTIYAAWELLDPALAKKIPGGIPGSEHADGMYGDVIREIDPSGKVVWEWHAATEMDVRKFPIYPAAKRKEYAHCNTVSPCANGDIIVNWRYNASMARIDKKTKKVVWSLTNIDYGQQHDAQELPNGNVLFFANGADLFLYGPESGSRVVEVDPRQDNKEVWVYKGDPPRSFFSWFISGAQRFENGNTLICEGGWGRFFEVMPDGEIVWEYVNPHIVEYEHPAYGKTNVAFRCYRYFADSPEIGGRLPADPS